MGTANRARRRAQQARQAARRAAQQRAEQDAPAGPGAPPSSPAAATDLAVHLLHEAIYALDRDDQVAAERALNQLAVDYGPVWRLAVDGVVGKVLARSVSALWQGGWQPADLLRVVERRLQQPHLRLLRAGIAAELAGYPTGTLDPRWAGQLAEGEGTVWWPRDQTAVLACGSAHPAGWGDFVVRAVELLHLLARLPRLELLGPVPGTASPSPASRAEPVDERILARVRALLAKAESTTFPAEAETFTAGAQALMARHSIDHALLAAAGRAPSDRPGGRRLGVDPPYEAPKASLLDAIASANRCRAVWSKDLGFATVIGYPTDLDSVELLFTSLLVQAVSALTRDGARIDGRSRTRAFRQSFLLAYAGRIRERLNEATREQAEQAAAEQGNAHLLPVLASRLQEVEQATDELFPRLRSTSAGSAYDEEGWGAGRAAADLASITPATPVTPS
jgi:hypothetical protein